MGLGAFYERIMVVFSEVRIGLVERAQDRAPQQRRAAVGGDDRRDDGSGCHIRFPVRLRGSTLESSGRYCPMKSTR